MNFESQPLQPHEIQVMKSDPVIIERVVQSYRLMLDFYGMRLVSAELGLVDRVPPPRNFETRYRNLVRKCKLPSIHPSGLFFSFSRKGSSHNYLRISRILKCLSELGLEHLNTGFLLHVLNEQSEWNELNSRGIRSSMDRWWANCIRNDEERQWIGETIRKVRLHSDEFIFTRDEYKKYLESRRTGRKVD